MGFGVEYGLPLVLQAFDDGRLFGARHGTGLPWVLALHGWRRTNADFDGVLAPAGVTPIDAIALDLPGFGATPDPSVATGAAGYAEAVVPVLRSMVEARGGPAVVIGHSFGGRVAVHLGAKYPELVGALVLTGVPLFRPQGTTAPKPKAGYRLARFLHGKGLMSDARMEALRKKYGSADYAAASGVMRQVNVAVVNEDYRPQLRALACPVELVWGDDDTAAPLAIATEALGLLAEGRGHLTVLSAAGHLAPLTAPAALTDALLRHRPAAAAPDGQVEAR